MRRGLIVVLGSWLLATAARADCDDPALTRAAAAALSTVDADPLVLARREGSTLPFVRGLRIADGDPDRGSSVVEAFVTHLAEEVRAPVVCGEASSEGRRLVLAGPRAAELSVEDGRVTVRLAEGWRDPRLYVRDAAGDTFETGFAEGRVDLPSDLAPPLDLQVVATGPEGPRPVAERAPPPAPAAPTTVVPRSDEPVARRIDRLREAGGVRTLRPNRLLDRVAARHAAGVCRSGRVAHLGEGGDPVERLAREGIRARHVGETVARAEDLEAAYAAMLRSPSHRAALSDARMTDVGVGRANGRCLVVLLAA
ncbi:MAG: CAP domain-containing protein, partial [Myxococcales bacterium]|nr:CAP domain-containing protein [Myxococcales bacterium]